MVLLRRFLVLFFAAASICGFLPGLSIGEARAEIFYCESTRTPNGSQPFCNFLLFDNAFTRHTQVIVAQGARREFSVDGRYDLFCVLVQNHKGVPDNFAYRKQQCIKSDTGREYKVKIRALNMRRGRDGFSSDTVNGLLPKERW
ncbi:hypothetical protein [Roseibium sp. M-1]